MVYLADIFSMISNFFQVYTRISVSGTKILDAPSSPRVYTNIYSITPLIAREFKFPNWKKEKKILQRFSSPAIG